MMRILITGKSSYVGNKVKNWIEKKSKNYSIEAITLRDNMWKGRDFSNIDAVFHVAGIAHKKETKKNESLYYKINRDLAFEVAKKAKNEKVKHFIFLSSMSVYGMDTGIIDTNSPIKPKSNYGKSKFQAENLISNLEDDSFKVSILRPPMIYGKNCKGNYAKLSKISTLTPIFPHIFNKRSMIYIDNFCEFVRIIIFESRRGYYHPQNEEYVSTTKLVEKISEVNGKKVVFTKIFNKIITSLNFTIFKKIFGDLIYDKKIDKLDFNYNVFNFDESIRVTEK
ncbi:NAD-dependent epimerase/dehydratase family protein [Halobacillus kuroshimensis]|uniref:NAD-dependent epimerase/dehydratase family protein n=1 Tax=Halobacillus kuroshimensis TaxID=302481 RepID=A0ABS3DV06_9BACI|nr:NAD-dependent epimerase/dehydratase family protein [Halobacillus kuroshimensis]MBN8235135.1 NAD-dependent epimerase/dehydratase family protein [Halobacillus kuroshimensis]